MTQRSNLISAQELELRLGSPDVRIVDCRFDLGDPQAGRQAYNDGHIPGAVFADLDIDLASPIGPDTGRHPLPDVGVFARTLGRLGIGNETEVIVYDGGPGALAARTWWLLRWMGHQRVRLLDGGLQTWCEEGRTLVAQTVHVRVRRFSARPRDEMVVTTAELVGDLGAMQPPFLVDARDAERFRGVVEPIDAVAGHIPGSKNLPFPLSLDEKGRFKARAALRALWAEVLGEDSDTEWIAMCGSGVTACHLAISALEAGYREPRLYVGSWSEWIRDPGRPVALGG